MDLLKIQGETTEFYSSLKFPIEILVELLLYKN